ncbi:MAG: SDR family oxidoreductase [Spirochaetales bacterium]|nr:SDR family oxidoreductase [Spirochaetales bacterium]
MKGKALITGGNSNLGKAIRKAFEEKGYEVYYTVSSKDKVDGPRAIAIDLRDENSVTSGLAAFSELDVLVNNAGIFTEGSQDSLGTKLFDEVMDLNVRGLFLATRALLPALRKCNGAIVNISSMNAVHPGFGTTSHYDASKGAVSSYTASLAAETGLRVNAVAPGLIDVSGLRGSELERHWNGHTVRNRMMAPEEIAKAVVFLAESQGIYGQTLLVDNGYCLR